MALKQTIKTLLLSGITLGSIGMALTATPVNAQQTCGDTETAIIKCTTTSTGDTTKDSAIWALLIMVINIMTAGIGILAVGAIAYGGVLYATAGGSSEQTKKAISLITNTVVGLVCFLLMSAILNYLIPGGVF